MTEINGRTGAPICVLLVDDEASFLEVSKRCLELEGTFQIDTAPSVNEATKKMDKKQFDAVVSDYKMPGKDGLKFLQELREKGDKTPFIMFTGKGREEVAIEALNLGADQYINKIGDPKTVYKELAHGIRKSVKTMQAERALVESEERYRSLVDYAAVGIAIVDLKGRLTYLNNTLADLMGYSVEELVNQPFKDFIHPNDRIKVIGLFLNIILLQRQPRYLEFRAVQKNGVIIHILTKPSRLIINGKTAGFQAIILDVTERKLIEDKLSKSELKYRSLLEGIGAGVATVDLRGRLTYVNKTLCNTLGFSEKEMVNKHFADFLHPDYKKDIVRKFLGAWKHPRKKYHLEFNAIHKDGHSVYMYSSPALYIYKKKIAGFSAIIQDITERKKGGEALQHMQLDSNPRPG